MQRTEIMHAPRFQMAADTPRLDVDDPRRTPMPAPSAHRQQLRIHSSRQIAVFMSFCNSA